MKTSRLLRISLHVFILSAFCMSSQQFAITQTRVSEINQFIADIKNNKLTAAQIDKREAELKRGLSERDLRAYYTKPMSAPDVKKALATIRTAPSAPSLEWSPLSQNVKNQKVNTDNGIALDLQGILGEDINGKTYARLQEIVKNKIEKKELSPEQAQSAKELFNELVGSSQSSGQQAREELGEVPLPPLPSTPVKQNADKLQRLSIYLGDIIRDLSKIWNSKAGPQDPGTLTSLKNKIDVTREDYIRLGSQKFNSKFEEAYTLWAIMKVFITGLESEVSWDTIKPISKEIDSANLFQALIKNEINLKQYDEALQARIHLQIAALFYQGERAQAACAQSLGQWYAKLTSVNLLSNEDEANWNIIKQHCTFYNKNNPGKKGDQTPSLPPLPVPPQSKVVIASTPEQKKAVGTIKNLTGVEANQKTPEEVKQEIKGKTEDLDLTPEEAEALGKAFESLFVSEPKSPKEVIAIEQKLNQVDRDIMALWAQSTKPNREQISEAYKLLGEAQQKYIISGLSSQDLAQRIQENYKDLGTLQVWSLGQIPSLTKSDLKDVSVATESTDLFKALEEKKITEVQYKKALNARLQLYIAAEKDPAGNACVNEQLLPELLLDLKIKNKSYQNADDKRHVEIIREKCRNLPKTNPQQEKKAAQAYTIDKQTKAYEEFIKPIEEQLKDKPDLVKVLNDEAVIFMQKLSKAISSLETDNIEALDFEPTYRNLQKAVDEKAKTAEEKKACKEKVLDPIALQIKNFIITSIQAHRRVTRLEQLPTAVRGENIEAARALDLVWQFETNRQDTDDKIPMIQQIQSMNNALMRLKLAFVKGAAGDDVSARRIETELFISFAYLCASFDSLMQKILTTKQGFFSWMGSWIGYMVYPFLIVNPFKPNPYSSKNYYAIFEELINTVGTRIINGIKIYDRALLEPILNRSTTYASYTNRLWHIKNTVPAFKAPTGQYKYASTITELSVPGSNQKLAVEPVLVLDDNQKKNWDTILDKVKSLVAGALKQVKAAEKITAEAALKELMQSINTVRQTAQKNNEPLSAHEANIRDAVENYQKQFNQ